MEQERIKKKVSWPVSYQVFLTVILWLSFTGVFLSFVAFHHLGAGERQMAYITAGMRQNVTIHLIHFDDFVANQAWLVSAKNRKRTSEMRRVEFKGL